MENSIISNNQASGTGAPTGGGIYATGGVIDGCEIVGNEAWGSANSAAYGAGIYIGGNVLVINSTIASNDVRQGGNQLSSYGGGIYMNAAAGVVSNCLIIANTADQTRASDSPARRGAGVYMTAGLVTHSRIVSNQISRVTQGAGTGYGGGVFMTGGTLRNSLIYRNEALHASLGTRGAGLYVGGASARVENCTVTRNLGGPIDPGDGIYMSAGTIVNTISYFNFDDTESDFEHHLNLYQSGGTVSFSCMDQTEGLMGSDNIAEDLLFIDRFANDFRLGPGSPARDSGTDLITLGVVDDIIGVARPQGNGYDMGAFEMTEGGSGPLIGAFTVSQEELDGGGEVTFEAFAAGSNTEGVTYEWYFDYDPEAPGTPDVSGSDRQTVTRLYTVPGNYNVRLTIKNSVDESHTSIRISVVRVLPLELFVAKTGKHITPFYTLENAATNIQEAIDTAPIGRTVWVAPGTYQVTTPLLLVRGVTIASIEGPEKSVIERDISGGNTRLITITDGAAEVIGFTLRHGYHINEGGAIWMSGGLVSRSIITNNTASGTGNGAGYGGGVWMSGGRVENSLIAWNTATRSSANSGNGSRGGGIYMTGGMVENCTVVTNRSLRPGTSATVSYGGGIFMDSSKSVIRNNIAAYNWARNSTPEESDIHLSTGSATYNHTYPGPAPVGDANLCEDPLFIDPDGGNFRLQPESPAVDSGLNVTWLADSTDLDGNLRLQRSKPGVSGKVLDRGAYELQPARGTILLLR